jgi:hypothetical protein
MFQRDHSEQYTPGQTGEIMSEGIGPDGDVSMEGATLLYKGVGNDLFRKYCTHICLMTRNRICQLSDVTWSMC